MTWLTGWLQNCQSRVNFINFARCTLPEAYWEANFYILRHTVCPAVLTENFFMDGLDLEFLQSKAGKQAVVDTHVEGIIEYIESFST